MTKNTEKQKQVLAALNREQIGAVFHYVPLHSTEFGAKLGRVGSKMKYTDDLANRLIRLPIYPKLTEENINKICNAVIENVMKL